MKTRPVTMTAAATANTPLPEAPSVPSSPEPSEAVERLSPWASDSSPSVAVAGSAASSIELERAGASLPSVSSPVSVSANPAADRLLLPREEPPDAPPAVLPEELPPDALLPAEALPVPEEVPDDLPDAAVTIVAFMSVLFPAV